MLRANNKNQTEKKIYIRSSNLTENFGRSRWNLIVVASWILFVALGFYFSSERVSGEENNSDEINQLLARAETIDDFSGITESDNAAFETNFEIIEAAEFPASAQNFSRFTHTNAAHRSLSCLMCHRRDTNAARPAFPGHTPCAGCHAQEFAKPQGESRICTICHTGSNTSAMKRFGGLKTFTVRFSHTQHNRMRGSCATCHTTAQSGSKWIPAGMSAHNTCFQCHTSRATSGGRDIASCSTCHVFGRFSRVPNPSNAYRVGFDHTSHRAINCAQCHSVRAGTRGNQVSEPTAAMHFPPARAQSCATCHNNKRAFGGNDFNDCKRCHTGTRFNL